MPKAYVKDWKEHPSESSSRRTFFDVTFDRTPERVKTFGTRELAASTSHEFQDTGIEVPSGKCEGFGVEMLAPNQFVIFCEYPHPIASPG